MDSLKLLIIRHGDPDYSIDSLTEKGWREAEYLAERLEPIRGAHCYVSPLGRAKATASCTLKRVDWQVEECPWLREFLVPVWRPDSQDRQQIPWDWLPQDWTREARFFLPDQWHEPEAFQEGGVEQAYGQVTGCFDALLERHGYRREGLLYRAVRANNDILVFFCHFGVECVLLSHLLHVSPMVLWQGTCAAPSSVTEVVTEERRPGLASFRISTFGDTSHLYCHAEPPSPAGRFCECYRNEGERRD